MPEDCFVMDLHKLRGPVERASYPFQYGYWQLYALGRAII